MVIFNSYVKLPEGNFKRVMPSPKGMKRLSDTWMILDDFGKAQGSV